MPSQALALAKQNIKSRLMSVLDRSQSTPVNFTAGQIHLGSFNLRSTEQSLEELATGAGVVFISHAQEGEVALSDWSGRFAITVDLIVRSAADSDERDWLDDLSV
ncbi:MAG TPA: hypothetical protein VL860_07120, partial [Planctomycetota bacterium]|nr:hypothetical protein [Planctomycetota bacterium]